MPGVDSPRLTSRIVDVGGVSPPLLHQLYTILNRHYADVDFARFARDFRVKQFALVLEEAARPVGFTTARLFDFEWRGEAVGVLFSGDTIVDRAHWGEQQLARAWLQQIGRLARQNLGRRMVWLLIAKGHRTYRYLPVFARTFVPRTGIGDAPDLIALRDAVAGQMFGTAFDPATGVIRFAMPQGRLRDAFAEPSLREMALPGVAWFLDANPGFRHGDELACLCDLGRDNMRPRARRWFDEGWHGG